MAKTKAKCCHSHDTHPTDKKRNERLRFIIWPWLWWLGIAQRYQIEWSWANKIDPGPWSSGQPDVEAAAAEGMGHYPYRTIVITISRKAFDRLDDEQVEEMLLHELMHADLFWPLRRIVNRMTETLVDKSDRVEYGTLEEAAADLVKHWLLRMKPKDGLKLLLEEQAHGKNL